MSVYYCRARRQTATASLTARPERREGRKLINQCSQIKPLTSPTNLRPQIKIQLSVIWTSTVRHSCPGYCGIRSPLAGREINELSPLISGAAISPHIERAWTFVLSTLDAFIAAPFWSGVCCAIYSTIFTSLLRLDREALPLELSASLLARGLTARFVSLAFYPLYYFIYHLSNAGLNA